MSMIQYRNTAGRIAKHPVQAIAALPVLARLANEARHDPRAPWYLEDPIVNDRHGVILLYGSLRRSGVMLRVPYLVLRTWWRRQFEPEIPTNGTSLISATLGGVTKPLLWILTVVIAGLVGSDFSSIHSNFASSEQLVVWSFIGLWVIVLTMAYQWWIFLNRLRRVLIAWVVKCNAMSKVDRIATDRALFGYALNDRFRTRFNAKGVKFLSFFTFSTTAYFTYVLGHR